jgi:hypothetical protein
MAFRCNIDRRGRLARLIYGLFVTALGILLVFTWALGSGSLMRWVACVALVVAGLFAVFEAKVGWCAVRAMGFKTPM